MDLNKLDLNLLLVFHQLMIERRVSATADALGVSQPAISNALRRLRQLLDDDLFIRAARGMEPTPFAERIAQPIAHALDTINEALTDRQVFEPRTSDRSFTLGMTDIGEIYIIPRLLARLSELAAGITLNTVRNSAVDIRDEMERGNVDATIGLLPQLQGGFFRQRLFHQKYVCAMGGHHPLAGKDTLSLEAFTAADHVVVVAAGTGHGEADKLMQRKGVVRRVRLTVPHFVAVGHILHGSDLIATIPERLASQLAAPFGLKYFPHPVALPEPSIDLFWHAKLHRDPANQWLRRLIFELFSG